MKIGHYTLVSEPYARVLQRLGEIFESRQVPYVIVGGAGIQIAVAGIITENGQIPIAKRKRELEILLRKTDDVDIATDSTRLDIGNALLQMQESNPGVLIEFTNTDPPHLCLNGGKDPEMMYRIRLNIQISSQDFAGLTPYYHDILESAQAIPLRYHDGGEVFEVNIPSYEFLIASKLTRGKEKDIIDIHNLIKSARGNVNKERIREVLMRCGKPAGVSTLDNILREVR